ncbi:hypothetical protein P5673_026019 [Acropora cervicornis]|uniref:Treslin STD domain-containing protein n=1 Tax=Acropora cervicornis TaxID=6130 RepID=A0AAD9Q1Y9_ACRCE|nr:hypothetical protein P5673_026019 [Acropora cervicornis]
MESPVRCDGLHTDRGVFRVSVSFLLRASCGGLRRIGLVTDLLRAISFMKDLNFLAVFLREVLLTRYCRRLPNFLCSIYEGLMIRPPKEILTPSKCSAVNESPMRRSVSVISNQPRLSGGCRVFTRHLSAKDVPTKRREIFVPLKSKQKENGKKKKAELPQFVSAKGTMPMSAVQETPARKQVPHALWNKQDRARVEQREFSRTRKRKRAYKDPGDDQLSENHDDSSDIDSDDFAVEEDGANRDMQNDELGFLFASRRT